MHKNASKPVDVHSEHRKQATAFAGAVLLDELNGGLDIGTRNGSRVAIDDRRANA